MKLLLTTPPSAAAGKRRRRYLPLAATAAASATLLLFLLSTFLGFPGCGGRRELFLESKLRPTPPRPRVPSSAPPRLAYFVSGSAGESYMLARLLLAIYHPRNLYVLHLELAAGEVERRKLEELVAGNPVVAAAGNVRVVERANLVTYRGPTMVSNTLHAAASLLRSGDEWDWFINLSASDYPLVSQDDLLHVFSELPRDLNFVEHSSNIGWKESQRAKPVIIDPGLYMSEKADVFWIRERRSVPTAFKLFTGSAWMALSRPFLEYCIWGWDNLPRTVLMYYANFISSPEGYFHTVVCNAEEFKNTTVNHDLHFISWDNPPKQHPHYLTDGHFHKMVASGAPFARKFRADDPVLDKIDADILFRRPGMPVPGGWCMGKSGGANSSDVNCSEVVGDSTLQPGPGMVRLKKLVSSLLLEKNFRRRQCK